VKHPVYRQYWPVQHSEDKAVISDNTLLITTYSIHFVLSAIPLFKIVFNEIKFVIYAGGNVSLLQMANYLGKKVDPFVIW
jgi:hypothetical protein